MTRIRIANATSRSCVYSERPVDTRPCNPLRNNYARHSEEQRARKLGIPLKTDANS